jgi:hypothetical protein
MSTSPASGLELYVHPLSFLASTNGTIIVAYPFLAGLESWSEDCLFLDILVPGKAIRGEAENLPVLFWIFGGGYGKSCLMPKLAERPFRNQTRMASPRYCLIDQGANGIGL